MQPFHWNCPFCNRDTTITDSDLMIDNFIFNRENKHGKRAFTSFLIACPNPKCKEFTYALTMSSVKFYDGRWTSDNALQTWNIIPLSQAKIFPAYIPKPVLDDYSEACLIRDLSPKASATLSRRCLQGMIRDFWGIKKSRLIDEIEELKGKVESLTWDAIDAVRKIGNIGAHMEKDINVIVDVEPEEAGKLIELIELLLKDWYIGRFEREQRLKAIVAVKDAKDAAKAGKP